MPGSIKWLWDGNVHESEFLLMFPPFLKTKVFVFYIIPAGLMTKEAVPGKEIPLPNPQNI